MLRLLIWSTTLKSMIKPPFLRLAVSSPSPTTLTCLFATSQSRSLRATARPPLMCPRLLPPTTTLPIPASALSSRASLVGLVLVSTTMPLGGLDPQRNGNRRVWRAVGLDATMVSRRLSTNAVKDTSGAAESGGKSDAI
ncbi:hypothetical protein B0J13DRAFT_674342 [Dactylonectria estremocensis]|uniref:Uncharacterized protein n=1 Tax=Dactylonectria estremocensis TaxID=1079267 RepID=A0A9P9EWH1_9HYPO|nr:hypothetical protein B0J13DRAFT_674342 [Dactylonectria estremocensis]